MEIGREIHPGGYRDGNEAGAEHTDHRNLSPSLAKLDVKKGNSAEQVATYWLARR